MIQFVNLQTGNIYDGSQPYIHWFEGQQSTGLIYSQPICFITDEENVTVELKSNEIFSLVNPHIQSIENVNGFEYKNINDIKVEKLSTDSDNEKQLLIGESYDGYKIYIIYIIGTSQVGAEYVEVFKINGNSYNIGADFYQEDETLYINASNFGINIPESIQKAIYDSNVHEEKKDNILLNRKLKELLSNYWDIIANKGSYKSLINSLKWFEWGDLVRIREIWKHENFGKTIYDDRALCSILEDKYKDTLSSFAKTTYISLYSSMQKIVGGEYDSEKNPKLENIVTKWSRNDLALKLCLLGNFYETYFMPIHLDLIHSTIEDIVFTNTVKIINSNIANREDYVYDVEDFKCIVNNNQPIVITNISVSSDKNSIGVKPISEIGEVIENEFWSNYYNGPGALVNIKCEIPVSVNDFIKYEKIHIYHNDKIIYNKEYNKIFTDNLADGKLMVPIEFNVVIEDPGEYEMILQFSSASSRNYTKSIKFNVIDITSTTLNIYKIKRKKNINYEELQSAPSFYKSFNRLPLDKNLNTYKNIIPITNKQSSIGLNHILALTDECEISQELKDGYIWVTKEGDGYYYNIGISKSFMTSVPKYNDILNYIVKSELGFFPEFHELEPFGTKQGELERIDNYIIKDDTLCVIPTINSKDSIINFNWGKETTDRCWIYENMSTGETFEYQDITNPIIAGDIKLLTPGYYNIIFKYSLLGDPYIHELKLNSAFIKK